MSYESRELLQLAPGPLIIQGIDWQGRPVQYEFVLGHNGGDPIDIFVESEQSDSIISTGGGPMRVHHHAPEHLLRLVASLDPKHGGPYRQTNTAVEVEKA